MKDPPAPPADPDHADLVAAAAGDQLAFGRLVDRHLPQIHRLAWRSLGNRSDAEDVAQEAFLRAFRQLPRWQAGRARFSTWLYRVTLNLCHDRLRQRREWVPLEALELVTSNANPRQAFEHRQMALRLATAIAALPRRQREALLLCHYEGYRSQEAAQVLKISTVALDSLLGRARRSLRKALITPESAQLPAEQASRQLEKPS